jgi:predicted extracellular nuclease
MNHRFALSRFALGGLCAFCLIGFSLQEKKTTLLVAWWNVENLYDTTDDPNDDDEFTPQGKNNWNEERLKLKFEHLAQVIKDMSKAHNTALPDVMGFCEVEHQALLETLFSTYLKSADYGFVYYESSDMRGIDVGFAYNKKSLTLVEGKRFYVDLKTDRPTRDVVMGKFSRNGKFLYVFGNHFPSRRGGKEESEPRRIAAAQTLRAAIDEILKNDSNADIIVLGDFNDEPTDKSIADILKSSANPDDVTNDGTKLYNFMAAYQGIGSYLFRREWSKIDQALVSKGMLNKTGFSAPLSGFQCFSQEYMFEEKKSGEKQPFRTYAGNKWLGGYADHLPICLEVVVEK